MYFLIVFSFISIILINIPFIIEFKLSRKNNDDNLHIYFKLTRKINIIQLEIPYVDLLISKNDIVFDITRDIENTKKSLNKKNKTFSMDHAIKILKKIYKNHTFYNFIKSFKNYMLKKIKIETIIWETKIGYSDAAVCALATGCLWAIKSIIINYIYSKYKLIKFKYDVNTIYNENVFEIDFDCIIKFKVISIIKGILFSLLSIVKGGELDA